MEDLVANLHRDYPGLTFAVSTVTSWSPFDKQVSYDPTVQDGTELWSVLHELGHALLDHTGYDSDVDLLRKEVAAWAKAEELAERYKVTIDQSHIQNCLDTYRDWVHKRSICPSCHSHGLQQSITMYSCPNCSGQWRVSRGRFCRPYRLSKLKRVKKSGPPNKQKLT